MDNAAYCALLYVEVKPPLFLIFVVCKHIKITAETVSVSKSVLVNIFFQHKYTPKSVFEEGRYYLSLPKLHQ